jgi:phage antirepressor YoqD-like protein
MKNLNSAQCAKILGLKNNEFNTILNDLEIIENDNTPNAVLVERNLFSVYLKRIKSSDSAKADYNLTWYITPIGLDYIHKLFLQHGVKVKPSIFV